MLPFAQNVTVCLAVNAVNKSNSFTNGNLNGNSVVVRRGVTKVSSFHCRYELMFLKAWSTEVEKGLEKGEKKGRKKEKVDTKRLEYFADVDNYR